VLKWEGEWVLGTFGGMEGRQSKGGNQGVFMLDRREEKKQLKCVSSCMGSSVFPVVPCD
jgi:hypothetical protein